MVDEIVPLRPPGELARIKPADETTEPEPARPPRPWRARAGSMDEAHSLPHIGSCGSMSSACNLVASGSKLGSGDSSSMDGGSCIGSPTMMPKNWLDRSMEFMIATDAKMELDERRCHWHHSYVETGFQLLDHSRRTQAAAAWSTFFTQKPFQTSVVKLEVRMVLVLLAVKFLRELWVELNGAASLCYATEAKVELGSCGIVRGTLWDLIEFALASLGSAAALVGFLASVKLASGKAKPRCWSRSTLMAVLILKAMVQLVTGLFGSYYGHPPVEAARMCKMAVGRMIVPIILLYAEKWLVCALLSSGLWALSAAVYDAQQIGSLGVFVQYAPLLAQLLWAGKILLERVWGMYKSNALIQKDQAQYDAWWDELMEDPKKAGLLGRLHHVTERISAKCPKTVRQCYKRRSANKRGKQGGGGSKSTEEQDGKDRAVCRQDAAASKKILYSEIQANTDFDDTTEEEEEEFEIQWDATPLRDSVLPTLSTHIMSPHRKPLRIRCMSAMTEEDEGLDSRQESGNCSPLLCLKPTRNEASQEDPLASFDLSPRDTEVSSPPGGGILDSIGPVLRNRPQSFHIHRFSEHAKVQEPFGKVPSIPRLKADELERARPSSAGKRFSGSFTRMGSMSPKMVFSSARRMSCAAASFAISFLEPKNKKTTRTKPYDVDVRRPINDISSLFISAHGVSEIFLEVVQALAALSGGCFRVESGTGFHYAKWQTAPWGTVFEFAKLKSHTRAIEKCWRSYEGDPSRLCDVCRQAIIFESIEEMYECVLAIERSEDIVVERVKNRLSPSWDSKANGGYRDILFNVRVVNERAMRQRVYHHVCELQLVLRDFAQLKTEEGHALYIRYRNMRGN